MKFLITIILNTLLLHSFAQIDTLYYLAHSNYSITNISDTSYFFLDKNKNVIESGKLLCDSSEYFGKFGNNEILIQDRLQFVFISRLLNNVVKYKDLSFRIIKMSNKGMYIHNLIKNENAYYIITNYYDNSYDKLGNIIKTDTTNISKKQYIKILNFETKYNMNLHLLDENNDSWEPIICIIEFYPKLNLIGVDETGYLNKQNQVLKLNKYLNRITNFKSIK